MFTFAFNLSIFILLSRIWNCKQQIRDLFTFAFLTIILAKLYLNSTFKISKQQKLQKTKNSLKFVYICLQFDDFYSTFANWGCKQKIRNLFTFAFLTIFLAKLYLNFTFAISKQQKLQNTKNSLKFVYICIEFDDFYSTFANLRL